MIELERDESQWHIQVWADKDFFHVIVQETEDTYRYGSAPGWYVRDKNSERGPFGDFDHALTVANLHWGEVTLVPANRLRRDIEIGRTDEIGHFLLEYLATYGSVGIDVQELASQVFDRIEEEC
ncbi:MAG TPA: hypothetical protein VK735_18785 [Pseudonocardia sp.]|uniref:hypothetical protein n=1 Tax=Pseudonocardia sp. TaxID=60912 RepID=UPI002B887849|nr:hypothetical protein [Pseudonocardia sp.]HTF49494.1 hypothetical protein [Pseudonocardia sp.]